MRFLLLLLLLPAVFAQMYSPPLSAVTGNNSIAAAALEGRYNANVSQNATILLRLGDYNQTHNISASVELAALSPAIDNVSCVASGPSLIVARGHEEGHLRAIPNEGYPDFICDRDFYEDGDLEYFGWRCDLDGDDCIEYENNTWVVYDANVSFRFRNLSYSVPFSSTDIALPSELLSAMADASGGESLTANITGNVTFIYEINNRTFGASDCFDNLSNQTFSVPFSVERNFTVGGDRKLFFLRSPILREQWFLSNKFDTIALSQCPLYRAQIVRNDEAPRNFTLKEFFIVNDSFGLYSISSRKLPQNMSAGNWSESINLTSPFPLENESDSFAFIYEINLSYDGLGENNFSIFVEDGALRNASYNESVTSRMLSHGNGTTENGSPAELFPSRPSAEFRKETLSPLEVGLGLVALVMILAFINFWIIH